MSRFLLISSSLCAAVLLAACAQTPPKTASASADNAPARSSDAAFARSAPSAQSAQIAQPAQAAGQHHVASVEFRVAQVKPAKNLTEVHLGKDSIWVLPEPVFTRADLSGVGPIKTQQGQIFVRFSFNAFGAKKLAALTQQNVGKLLVVSIDGNLAALPEIGGPMTQGILNVPVPNEKVAFNITDAIVGAAATQAK